MVPEHLLGIALLVLFSCVVGVLPAALSWWRARQLPVGPPSDDAAARLVALVEASRSADTPLPRAPSQVSDSEKNLNGPGFCP